MENQGVDYTRHPYLKGKEIQDSEIYIPPNPIVKGKLGRKKRITQNEIDFLKAHAPGAYKMTIPSPVTLSRSSYQPGVSDRIYETWEKLFLDYAGLVAAEVTDMVNDGVTYVQLDAPHYTRFVIPNRQKQLTDIGVDIERELELAIAAENICLRAAKRANANVTTAVHICLGTFILGPQGPLGGAGEYDETLVARLIGALDADVFLIEYSERTGSLEVIPQASEKQDHQPWHSQHARSQSRNVRRHHVPGGRSGKIHPAGESQHLPELRILRRRDRHLGHRRHREAQARRDGQDRRKNLGLIQAQPGIWN